MNQHIDKIKINIQITSLIDKIKEGEISLAYEKDDQIKFKSKLGGIKKETKKQIKGAKKHFAQHLNAF